ncbi:hypothetical protein DAEQUDRAFT_807882 [Daedalea quercina L-15889]|uniref:DUF6535 domain-containing protein n=1 Tax=Daedalea quercina L-15889 TaxID=1314783 RepID=A0A165U0F7_9APHY|nr:hypothetical protein DAEQUDRAFT_807882 [Daedalea quercina L-15889]
MSSRRQRDFDEKIYMRYNELFKDTEKSFIKTWSKDLDTVILFSTLFSAVVTAFVVDSYKALELPADSSADSPAPAVVRVNTFWFASLVISVSTAFVAIMAKEWLDNLPDGHGYNFDMKLKVRHLQLRYNGIYGTLGLLQMLSFVPFLLHISFLLFFIGLINFLWDINRTVSIVAATLVCIMGIAYCCTHAVSILKPNHPYGTSLTSLLLTTYIVLIRSSVLIAKFFDPRYTSYRFYEVAQRVLQSLTLDSVPGILSPLTILGNVMVAITMSLNAITGGKVMVKRAVAMFTHWQSLRGMYTRDRRGPAVPDRLHQGRKLPQTQELQRIAAALSSAHIIRARQKEYILKHARFLDICALARLIDVTPRLLEDLDNLGRHDHRTVRDLLEEVCKMPHRELLGHRSRLINAGADILAIWQIQQELSRTAGSNGEQDLSSPCMRALVSLLTEAEEGLDGLGVGTLSIEGVSVHWDIRLQDLRQDNRTNSHEDDEDQPLVLGLRPVEWEQLMQSLAKAHSSSSEASRPSKSSPQTTTREAGDIILRSSHALRLQLVTLRANPASCTEATLEYLERTLDDFYKRLQNTVIRHLDDDDISSLVKTTTYIGMNAGVIIDGESRAGSGDSEYARHALGALYSMMQSNRDMEFGVSVLRQIHWGAWMLSMPMVRSLPGLLVTCAPANSSNSAFATRLNLSQVFVADQGTLQIDQPPPTPNRPPPNPNQPPPTPDQPPPTSNRPPLIKPQAPTKLKPTWGILPSCYVVLAILEHIPWRTVEYNPSIAVSTSEHQDAAAYRDTLMQRYIQFLDWPTLRSLSVSQFTRLTDHVLKICHFAVECEFLGIRDRWLMDTLRATSAFVANLSSYLSDLRQKIRDQALGSDEDEETAVVSLHRTITGFTCWMMRTRLQTLRRRQWLEDHDGAKGTSGTGGMSSDVDSPFNQEMPADGVPWKVYDSIRAAHVVSKESDSEGRSRHNNATLEESLSTIRAFMTCLQGALRDPNVYGKNGELKRRLTLWRKWTNVTIILSHLEDLCNQRGRKEWPPIRLMDVLAEDEYRPVPCTTVSSLEVLDSAVRAARPDSPVLSNMEAGGGLPLHS